MVDGSSSNEVRLKLLAMERQALCLAEYFRRGDRRYAGWMIAQLQEQLAQLPLDIEP